MRSDISELQKIRDSRRDLTQRAKNVMVENPGVEQTKIYHGIKIAIFMNYKFVRIALLSIRKFCDLYGEGFAG